MASNDYYNSHPQQPNPQYESYRPDPSPAYHSQASSLHPSQRPGDQVSPIQPSASPFEAPFDDHVYPMAHHDPYRQDSQNTLASDPRYLGQQGGRQDSQNSFADNIPLQDHPQRPGKNNESTDHVYDATEAPPHMLEEGRQKKRRSGGFAGMFKSSKKRIPWVVYTLTLIQTIVFIVEIVKNAQWTGSPIQTKPNVNPMIGPSPWVLIHLGARYMPCMHNVKELAVAGVTDFGCKESKSNDVGGCTLSQLCGFAAFESPAYSGTGCDAKNINPAPNQWFRFIIPIFLHAGIIHIGFNMLLQLTLGREIEILIGPIRFFLVYMASGIFGFVLGGNYAAAGIASTGASGSLFGIMALNLLDLLYTWKERRNPGKELGFIILDVVISFVLGLLPGLDNFSHIGGFLMGLVLGICILHSPNALRKRINQDEPPYEPVKTAGPNVGVTGFAKSPVGFFKGRKPAWWAWWLVRAASLVVVFVVFILLLNNFYAKQPSKCKWCKHLTCLDIKSLGWCEIGNIVITNGATPTCS